MSGCFSGFAVNSDILCGSQFRPGCHPYEAPRASLQSRRTQRLEALLWTPRAPGTVVAPWGFRLSVSSVSPPYPRWLLCCVSGRRLLACISGIITVAPHWIFRATGPWCIDRRCRPSPRKWLPFAIGGVYFCMQMVVERDVVCARLCAVCGYLPLSLVQEFPMSVPLNAMYIHFVHNCISLSSKKRGLCSGCMDPCPLPFVCYPASRRGFKPLKELSSVVTMDKQSSFKLHKACFVCILCCFIMRLWMGKVSCVILHVYVYMYVCVCSALAGCISMRPLWCCMEREGGEYLFQDWCSTPTHAYGLPHLKVVCGMNTDISAAACGARWVSVLPVESLPWLS